MSITERFGTSLHSDAYPPIGGSAPFNGSVTHRVHRQPEQGWRGFFSHALPRRGQPREVNRWRRRMLARNLWQFGKVSFACWVARRCGVTTAYGRLSHRVIRGDGEILDYGIASYRVVTTAFVNYLTSALVADQAFESFKYHGWGTGVGAEAIGDTALGTEFTTEYVVNSTRVTGSQSNSTNTYTTAGTFAPDSGSTLAVTEHAIFLAATGATTVMDRSQFSAVNLVVASGDSLASTYVLTASAGG